MDKERFLKTLELTKAGDYSQDRLIKTYHKIDEKIFDYLPKEYQECYLGYHFNWGYIRLTLDNGIDNVITTYIFEDTDLKNIINDVKFEIYRLNDKYIPDVC